MFHPLELLTLLTLLTILTCITIYNNSVDYKIIIRGRKSLRLSYFHNR
nr:MAG TPA: hypothetical protein [Caudoviricetes sp.]